jgi:transcriptional antiterminator NusG
MSELEAERPLQGQEAQPAGEPDEATAPVADSQVGEQAAQQGAAPLDFEAEQAEAAAGQEGVSAQPASDQAELPGAEPLREESFEEVISDAAGRGQAAAGTQALPVAESAPAASELAVPEQAAEDEAGALAQVEADDGRHWYVIHCYSGYENKVRHNLEQRIESMGMKDRIFDVVVPTEEEIEVKDGKRRTVERRVFPGYILVQMLLTEESWYVVRNTPGVTGFVGMGNEPTPLRPEEVAQIVRRMEAEAPRVKVTYKAGQKVRIIDGPFNDFIGTVDDIDMERAKVRVMVSFFGRETPVELDFLQVEKA